MNFYSVFSPTFEYKIYDGNQEIGSLDASYAVDLSAGDDFNLAGRLWSVKSINHDKSVVYVTRQKQFKGKIPNWSGDGSPTSYLISNKIYEILQGDFDKKYLKPFQEDAAEMINAFIEKAQIDEFRLGILPVEIHYKDGIFIYTFAGDKANKLLCKIFSMYYDTYSEFTTPAFASFKVVENEITRDCIESVIYDLENILNEKSTIESLDELTKSFKKNKFIQYLPEDIRGELKMDILYDKEGLLKATCDKSIKFISESEFRKNIFKKDKKE